MLQCSALQKQPQSSAATGTHFDESKPLLHTHKHLLRSRMLKRSKPFSHFCINTVNTREAFFLAILHRDRKLLYTKVLVHGEHRRLQRVGEEKIDWLVQEVYG